MCVSGVRSRVVSCECVCVSCGWASRRSSVVRREAFFVCSEIFDPSLRFRVEFWIRVSLSNLSSKFSIRISSSSSLNFRVVFWSRISNSSFSFRCSIRFLEFRCSSRLLEFRFFDSNFEFKFLDFFVSNSSSKFSMSCSIRLLEFQFSIRICRRNFRCLALFDFSKAIVKFDFSNFEFSSQVTWISNSSWSIRLLEFRFEFVVEISIRNCRRNCRFRVAFFIWVLNWTLQFSSKFWFASPIFVLNCELTSSIILARSLSLRSRCHASFARAFRA